MVVKKANGRIFGASLTKTEQKALEMEIQRQYSEYIKKFEIVCALRKRKETRKGCYGVASRTLT